MSTQAVVTKCIQEHQTQGTLLLSCIEVRRKGQGSGCWPLCPTNHVPPVYLKTGPHTRRLGVAVARALAYHSPVVTLPGVTPSRLEITADRARGDKGKRAQAQGISG